MINENGRKNIPPAGLTLRASLPPKEIRKPKIDHQNTIYSPEAEQAFSDLSFEKLPLIGYGKLYYFDEQINLDPDALIKPSPFHALATIKAAVTHNDWQSLMWAKKVLFDHEKEIRYFDDCMPRSFELHVFEDSFNGSKSSKEAVDILNSIGYDISLHSWGITENTKKKKAIETIGQEYSLIPIKLSGKPLLNNYSADL